MMIRLTTPFLVVLVVACRVVNAFTVIVGPTTNNAIVQKSGSSFFSLKASSADDMDFSSLTQKMGIVADAVGDAKDAIKSAMSDAIPSNDAISDAVDAAVTATGSAGGGDSTALVGAIAGVAVLALGGIFAAVSSKGGDGKKKSTDGQIFFAEEYQPIDVSIPYDAAAQLAYRTMKGMAVDADIVDDAEYSKFKSLYEETTVAKMTIKKKSRDLKRFQEEAETKQKELEAMFDFQI